MEVPRLLFANCHSKTDGEAALKLLMDGICWLSPPLLSILPTSSFPLSSHPQLQNLPSQFFSLCTQSYPLFTPACSQKPFCSSGKAWKIPDLLPRSGWQCSVFIRMQICLWTRFKESAFPSNGLPSSTSALVVFCVLVNKWEATGFQFEGTAAGGS